MKTIYKIMNKINLQTFKVTADLKQILKIKQK